MHALIHYFVTYFKLQNLQLKRDSLGDDGQTLIDNCKKDVDDKFFTGLTAKTPEEKRRLRIMDSAMTAPCCAEVLS